LPRSVRSAACRGPEPAEVVIGGRTLGAIACDGRTHALSVPAGLIKPGGQQLSTDFLSSELISYLLEFGAQR
jgi:hypothetical protein